MDRFGIIHLSDLQFGSKHRFGNPSTIHKTLGQDILQMSDKYKFTPIYLIITGDISETANLNEFTDAINCISSLCKSISIDKESVLSVPGNHDINWKLSEISTMVGDNMLKYSNYNKFAFEICNKYSVVNNEYYNKFLDHRFGIEFLYLNSCEKEDHENHFGFVDKDKLLKSIFRNQVKEESSYTKICLVHHRIEQNDTVSKSVLNNSYEIETILNENGYNIILSGHIHESRCFEFLQNNKKVIHTGAGSTGVDATQRVDGIQNQYSIHILDSFNKHLETLWRSYNPNKRTQFGLGGWTNDNSVDNNPSVFELPNIESFEVASSSNIEDFALIRKYKIKQNPFTYSNAEKISANQLVKLFVSSEGRNKSAVRLVGDAILRGSRGSGKTMLLRYLHIFGNITFNENFKNKKVSESFPVLVNLSLIHNSEWKKSVPSLVDTSEKLIFDSVLNSLDKKAQELHSHEFRNALFQVRQRLNVLSKQEGSAIWKLGEAIKSNMSNYFSHILLLIDEVAPVFPKEFFSDVNNGFLRWMNSIRNSGPFFTRIAIYPNDFSDVLNEDRFGAIVNLDFEIKNTTDYLSFRSYCIELVNNYLKIVSISKLEQTKISDIIEVLENSPNDSLEQLIYASDGSSRRFIGLFDKCITSTDHFEGEVFNKEKVLKIITEFSNNLLSSYDVSERELANSIAKASRKQGTNRFRLPGLTSLINPLHAKNEELNIVKLTEVGTGRRGTTYEFTYPYCILMEIPTHNLKGTRKICTSRDYITGEWITQVTTINKDQLDYLNDELRIEGIITDIDIGVAIVTDFNKNEYLTESIDSEFKLGDRVSFIYINSIASDLIKIKSK